VTGCAGLIIASSEKIIDFVSSGRGRLANLVKDCKIKNMYFQIIIILIMCIKIRTSHFELVATSNFTTPLI